jgi:2-polyprenyl-3-methyl-5-hydroxy-6-metoxy-1,4-benzoquinol methylase
MAITSPVLDRSREMDEKSWWDLWNTSHRTKDNNDAVSSELFRRAAATINGITRNENCSILEVACGTGTLSRMLVYSSYHGLDISSAAIEVARQKSGFTSLPPAASPPTYEAADFHEWSLPLQPFDVAICIDAISSIRDQPVAMKKIAQGLRIGGRLVLTTINRYVYDRIQRTPTVRFESGPVSHWLSRAELRALIVQAGLTIERFTTIMPRGDLGILRWINSAHLNESFGPGVAAVLRRLKEQAGFGQYSLVVARKDRP